MSSSGMPDDSEHDIEDSQINSNDSSEEETYITLDEETEATPETTSSEEDEISRGGKRKRQKKKTETDIISSLADPLLHHILSFLDIDDAVRTSLISKRWQYLWTSMPDFTFSQNNSGMDINQFVALVYRTLLYCNTGKLNKLAVEFWYLDSVSPDIDAWIRFATRRNVENLELHLITEEISDDNYQLPQHLYRNTSLTNLRLSSVKVMANGVVGWTSLKSLTLDFLQLTADGMAKILSGSPVLEFLEMNDLQFIGQLNIYSTSLKELVIRPSPYPPNASELKISAPNLQSLHVEWSSGRFFLLDVSSLVSAYIDFTTSSLKEISKYVNNLLQSIKHVNELEIGSRCIKVFSKLESKGLLYFPSTLKVLKLDVYKKEDIIPCLSGLLCHTRNVETLFVEMDHCCGHACLIGEKKHWESLGRCLHESWIPLKTVKISGRCHYHRTCMIELVKFLLKNAVILEKMVICTRDFVKVGIELQNFPRSSPNAVIIFS